MDDLTEHTFRKSMPPAYVITATFRNGRDWWMDVPDDSHLKLLARHRLREAGRLVGRRVETHYIQGRMWGGAELTAGEMAKAQRELANRLEALFHQSRR